MNVFTGIVRGRRGMEVEVQSVSTEPFKQRK